MHNESLQSSLEDVSNKLDADILIYSGAISSSGVDDLIEATQEPRRKNILLILCTPGGDAHSAFKIARYLQEKYENFYLYVYGYCKSAGTLIAIGSDEIIMSDYAEFGPLDVQLQEKDEIWKYSSGLNISESLMMLKAETLHFFRSTLIELAGAARISTKTAAKLATNLAIGFINPIIAQIDPVRVGEIQRAVKIALAYGEKLTADRGNLRSAKELARLVQEYPDHGFVIDYKEARDIFKKVRKHDQQEEIIGRLQKEIIRRPLGENGIIRKIYPSETDNEQSYKSASFEGIKQDKREARKTSARN